MMVVLINAQVVTGSFLLVSSMHQVLHICSIKLNDLKKTKAKYVYHFPNIQPTLLKILTQLSYSIVHQRTLYTLNSLHCGICLYKSVGVSFMLINPASICLSLQFIKMHWDYAIIMHSWYINMLNQDISQGIFLDYETFLHDIDDTRDKWGTAQIT